MLNFSGSIAILAGIVAIAWGSIQIYKWHSTLHRLRLTFKPVKFLIPSEIRIGLEELASAMNAFQVAYKVVEQLKSQNLLKEPIFEFISTIHTVESSLKNLTERHRYIRNFQMGGVLDFAGLTQFKISNDGKEEVKDLILEIGEKGLYQIVGDDMQSSRFDRMIKVSSIRSASTIAIWVWTTHPLTYSSNTIRLTHPSGAVRATKLVYSKPRSFTLLDIFGYLIMPSAYVVAILILYYNPPLVQHLPSPTTIKSQ